MRRPVNLGHDSKSPLVLGQPNGDPARFVEGTGLYLAVRKGDQRWVTGTAVQGGLQSGVLIDVHTDAAPAMSDKQLAAAAATEPVESTTVAAVPADADLAGLAPAPKAAAASRAAKKPAAKPAPKPAAKLRQRRRQRRRRRRHRRSGSPRSSYERRYSPTTPLPPTVPTPRTP